MDKGLPPSGNVRWVKSKKFAVIHAIRTGKITAKQAEDMYNLSEYELKSWQTLLHLFGDAGLRSTRIQDYRERAGRVSFV